MDTKICINCGRGLLLERFYKSGFKNGKQLRRSRCIHCMKIGKKDRFNWGIIIKRCPHCKSFFQTESWHKIYDTDNCRARASEVNRKKNGTFYTDQKKKYNKKYYRKRNEYNIQNLTDHYIKKLLTQGTNLLHRDIPSCLVDIKRQELKLKRLNREVKNEKNGQGRNNQRSAQYPCG